MRQSIILFAVLVQLVACTPGDPADSLPPVTVENCEPAAIAKIKDRTARSQFTDLCVRRNTFHPSPKREW
ncbi:entry exclusion lipoprotein TrbK [Janthinobacterium lividum]|uniref:Entry exclusion lipoprotein TrbK n=1 Tax=Janthinobacterium lividum TaxID=29581 RepID=A0A5C4NTK8_9BURK|nr:entry exclusion lipoprotein TrbK [Janthinobacterium lividum]TNC78214.1 entry exclusion lipoprotein TrbK [Janthinobacterium lividum]